MGELPGRSSTVGAHVTSARAVYDASVERYVAAIGTDVSETVEASADLDVLAGFARDLAGREGPVADLGCGPGRVAAHLAARGLDVVGLDLSAGMLVAARRAHPGLRVVLGSLADLPLSDGSLAGAVCWYSIIHTPPARLDEVFAELARVLVSGGRVLVAFQSGGGEAVHRPDAHGTGLPLTSHRHRPDAVVADLAAAGFDDVTRTERGPAHEHETTPQAFVVGRRSST